MAKIIWSSKATSDLKNIFDYWNFKNKSTNYSRKLNFIMVEKLKQIAANPKSGISTNFKNVRAILFENYYLHYSIQKEEIRILRIWDVRQNPEKFEL